MIIYEQPKFGICTCEKCGTVFQPEPGDTLYFDFKTIDTFEVSTRCPTCYHGCPVTMVGGKSKGGETDV